MGIIRYTFDEVKSSRKFQTFCRLCQKKLTRTASASQTINPYNKNKVTGEQKTCSEIHVENSSRIQNTIEEQQAKGVVCRGCDGEPK